MYHLIHEKLQVFYELGIIRKNDRRIRNIQTVLEGKNEIQIDNWAHDIVVGNKTLDEALYGGRN
jgi:hypothetical protein